ncbi:MAG: ATP-binding protein [Planctomycetaceae bacterium]|jgi:Cdc6-like AAA superfamily ATPase|nr:ATP-binding protein [Planctomycetaceae bacterium]
MREFNTAGPCNNEEHYMVDASTRLTGVEQLIDGKKYFVIHAARQSGKTTYLQDLTRRLNATGKYYALCCSLEGMQGVVEPEKGIPEIVRKIKNELEDAEIPHCLDFAKKADYENFTDVLRTSLTRFCKLLDKPLVILFDEVDCLGEGTLISFLRQLRDGYNKRSITRFVHSIAIVGMRNIRDFRAQVRPDHETVGSASPFNIAKKSLTLKNFTQDEIITLYRQHTDETGQIFNEDVIKFVFDQTQGQPWLVNAIACEVIVELLQSDYSKPVTTELVNQAIQNIIFRRDTHIDSLLERLNEERVRKVIEPMILGNDYVSRDSEDFLYTRDLGLIREVGFELEPANPIYAEIIIRKLSGDSQRMLHNPKYPYQMPRYLSDDHIDMDILLKDFQQFWRVNSESWVEFYDYKEAAPHLILMAFLQRVINGGGQVIRAMATGNGRLDLYVEYKGQKYPVELKIWRGEKYLESGFNQIMRYMDILGSNEGWLVIFDQRKKSTWDERIFMKKEIVDGKTITIVGA